ncbi:MAG: zinc-binding dehydrogenase [Gordonia sp. (in: high G+C Gram-positive bacteria)]
MKALTVTAHDRFDGLTLVDHDDPRPGPGEVTVDVQFAGVGLIDALWVTGAMPAPSGFVPGLEVSGTISEVGDGVSEFAVGECVAAFASGAGGFAEVVRASVSTVARVPDGMSMEQAAVVPVNTVTAHLALTRVVRVDSGDEVLVFAGVGGLGSQFAQVARVLGAGRTVAVVGTPEKQEAARALGYDDALLRDDLTDLDSGAYDLVVDPVGGAATTAGFRALRSGGRMIRVGNASQAPGVPLDSTAFWLENKTVAGFIVGAWIGAHPADGAESLRWALDAVARGQVRVDLTAVGSRGRARELLAELERGATVGKVALDMRA